MSWILKIDTPVDGAEWVSTLLWGAGTTGVSQVTDDRGATLVAGFETEASARSAVDLVLADSPDLAVLVSEWTNDWASPPPKNLSVGGETIIIDAGHAFGHGGHTTTALLLEWLADPGDRPALAGLSVLDVGTGSGVLAIAAAKLGAHPVVAIDRDPEAIESALINVRANSANVTVSDITTPDLDGTFDLVLANMLLVNLVPVAGDLARLTGDRLLISGVLDSQIEEISERLVPLALADSRLRDGWAALEFRRSPRD